MTKFERDLTEIKQEYAAQYQWEDIKDGKGFVTYYLYATENSSAVSYKIETQQCKSAMVTKDTSTAETTLTFYSNGFNLPSTINGIAIFTFCNSLYKTANDGTGNLTFEIKVYHYDGSTSTQLGDTWTSPTQSQENAGWNAKTFSASIDLGEKLFKVGDQIKVEVKYTPSGGVGFDVAQLGLSPNNRDDTNANGLQPSTDTDSTTQFAARIPFRLSFL